MYGAIFSQTGKPVNNKDNLIYNSDKNQLKVSIVADPKHLDVMYPLKKMVNLTTTTSSYIATETLFQIEHGMSFRPSVSAYFHIVDTPVSDAFLIGRYALDFFRLNGRGLLYADVDDTYFSIKHDKYHDFNIGAPATQTDTGLEQYIIRFKYLISNARFVDEVALTRPT